MLNLLDSLEYQNRIKAVDALYNQTDGIMGNGYKMMRQAQKDFRETQEKIDEISDVLALIVNELIEKDTKRVSNKEEEEDEED